MDDFFVYLFTTSLRIKEKSKKQPQGDISDVVLTTLVLLKTIHP
jgi:hypothetical protein